jgi:hypothetical protein
MLDFIIQVNDYHCNYPLYQAKKAGVHAAYFYFFKLFVCNNASLVSLSNIELLSHCHLSQMMQMIRKMCLILMNLLAPHHKKKCSHYKKNHI